MEKVREFLKKIPDWVKAVVASAVIVAVAVVVNDAVSKIVRRNSEIIEDDFSCVFQIDNVEKKANEIVLTGWAFELNKNAEKKDFDIILYDYKNDDKFYAKVEDINRKDVNDYFLCEYDYSESGFRASIKNKKIDLENINYEVLIQKTDGRKAISTGTYISEGRIMYVKPENYVALQVQGTELEDVVNNGILRVHRPDVGMYVYQYAGNLYWIADEHYEFEEDDSTLIQYHLETTQINNLPQHRLDNDDFWDNISFDFKAKEIANTGIYRVATSKLSKEYSVKKIWTGYYNNNWVWIQYFRPWYEFD